MDNVPLLRLLPTMPILMQALEDAGWACTGRILQETRAYRTVCEYRGQKKLHEDVLYLLGDHRGGFPVDRFAYVSAEPVEGSADHFCCTGLPAEELLEALGSGGVTVSFRVEWSE